MSGSRFACGRTEARWWLFDDISGLLMGQVVVNWSGELFGLSIFISLSH